MGPVGTIRNGFGRWYSCGFAGVGILIASVFLVPILRLASPSLPQPDALASAAAWHQPADGPIFAQRDDDPPATQPATTSRFKPRALGPLTKRNGATAPASSTPPPPGLVNNNLDAKRIRIRTATGATVIARVHGQGGGETSVMLPDGQLGFTEGTAFTDEPFRPRTMAQMRDELTSRGPFAKFQVKESAHYLLLYQSTPEFAEASIRLLENLYRNLSEAFRKRNVMVHDAEFPLVAIIFRTEREFRAHKRVDPEVQAYYEILSNRIFFYQKSERDQQSPEVAALRKPQTVAHEGTHQILQNIGVQPRLSEWPLWLVEGLAEYCSPPTMTKRGASWGGIGLVNPMHMATIHDLDDPASLQVKGANRPRMGRDPRMPLVEYLVTRTELTPTDYALSWALTHYLAMKRGSQFITFLQMMAQVPPLEKRTPEDQLASFRAAFGNDLAKMDKTIATYLSRLKYDPLPYYAVMFQQPIGRNMIRRAAMVSQSPSVIRQWINEMSEPNGGTPSWEIQPFPNRSRALFIAQGWMQNR